MNELDDINLEEITVKPTKTEVILSWGPYTKVVTIEEYEEIID